MWILAGSLAGDDIDRSLKTVKKLVKDNSGNLQEAYHWEQRTLAYAIAGQDIGHYCVANFSATTQDATEIDKTLQKDTTILRYLLNHKSSAKILNRQ